MTRMHPFELPDFYMPYPARLNPHLGGARVHSKAWAFEVGILSRDGEAIWDEATFDAMDFALFTAQTHPDVHAPELSLLTDWYVWGWYVDDFVAKVYEQSRDVKAAREYLARLPAFMPEDLGTPVPAPENPMERALCDLWPRTGPTMSVAWRRRYVEHIVCMADTGLQDIFLATLGEPRVLDPVQYVSTRRVTSGMMWSADLVEHSLGAEIPAHLYDSRPIRAINSAFFDSVALRNDIVSYPRDVAEGKVNNGVMVVRELLGSGLQRAVNVVNDLVSSRLFQFEHTCAVELPLFFADRAIDPATHAIVLRYARGVQDWMAGDFEWETRPGGRYLPAASEQERPRHRLADPADEALRRMRRALPGIRRVESHTHVPFQKVGPVTLPEIHMPFPCSMSPHVDEARKSSKEWARRMGMLDELPGAPGGFIWNEHTFDAADMALCGALVYPDTSPAALDLSACWLIWMIYTDDYFPMIYGRTRDRAGARRFHERIALFMPLDAAVPGDVPQSPVERGLLDLWLRTAGPMPMHARRRFHEAVRDLTESWLWELDNQLEHRLPDPVDYLEMRRRTFGWDLAMTLARPSLGEESLRGIVAQLEAAMSDVGCLMNDIFSFQKEIEFHGELHNAVLIVQRFLDLDQAQALVVTRDLVTARTRQFEHMAAVELPAILDDLETSEESREELRAYVEWMQKCMAGLLRWYTVTGRYQEAELVASEWPEKRFAHALAKASTSLGLATPPALLAALREAPGATPPAAAEPTLRLPQIFTGLGTAAARLTADTTPPPSPLLPSP